MRIWIVALLSAGLLWVTPLTAEEKNTPKTQVDKPTGDEAAEMMRSMFKVEALAPEQRTRLPQAEALVARIMPPGIMNEVMGGMYDKLLGPIMAMAEETSGEDIARELGVDADAVELEDGKAARVAAIIDPVWKERRGAEMAGVRRGISTVMTAMEPGMRKGLAEAYAINFTAAEMTDIAAFFATPSGATFARKSYALASDPRIMAASMEALPAMMAQFEIMEEEAKAATAKFPPRRSYADLTPAEREEIAKITGLGQGAIRAGMERAAAERAEKSAWTTRNEPAPHLSPAA